MKMRLIGLLLIVSICAYGQLTEKQKNYFDQKMNEVNYSSNFSVGLKNNLMLTYENLCNTRPDLDDKQCLKMSVAQVIQDTSLIHAFYKKDIDAWTNDKYVRAIDYYKSTYKLNNEQATYLSEVLYDKSKSLVLAYYQYPEDETKRYVLETQINDSYNATLMVKLTKLGFKTYLARYCSAMEYCKELELTQDQINKIVANAVDINRQSETLSNYTELKYEEYRRLQKVLTEKQYDTYLTNKVATQARLQTIDLWNELNLYSGAADLDSTATYNAIYPYLVKRFKIEERYKILPEGETEAAKQKSALYKMCPEQLLRLYALRKKAVQKNVEQTKLMTW